MQNSLSNNDDIIFEADKNLRSFVSNGYAKSVVYYGRKNFEILSEIKKVAKKSGVINSYIDVSNSNSFRYKISIVSQEILHEITIPTEFENLLKKTSEICEAFRATYNLEYDWKNTFELGISDTGYFQNDLTELFLVLGRLAKYCKKNIVFFIDKMQNLSPEDLDALIVSLHRINQFDLPIALFGTGNLTIIKKIIKMKSYGERLFNFVDCGGVKNRTLGNRY